MTATPPVWQMIRQAIEELGSIRTNVEVRDAVLARYPATKPNTVSTQINICTVNSPSRIHYPENQKPRVATDARYDFLFRVGRGQVEHYDPAKHGVWEILKDTDGHLHVAMAGDEQNGGPEPGNGDSEPPVDGPREPGFVFGLERELRDFLAANLGSLAVTGGPLSLYVDDSGQSGVEYRTGVGPIDILAVDADDGFVVFELKLSRGPDAAAGQLLRYLGWVRRNLAGGRAVRGVIVARTVDEKLRYAASEIPNVSLFEYSMSFSLQPADAVGKA